MVDVKYFILFRANTPATDPFSIFEHFGFGGMGGRRGQEEESHTPNIEIPVRVSLRQLYVGEILDVAYSRQVLCVEHSKCQKNCPDCQGAGVKVWTQQLAPGFVQQVQVYQIYIANLIRICSSLPKCFLE